MRPTKADMAELARYATEAGWASAQALAYGILRAWCSGMREQRLGADPTDT
jgi:hypothetical protein